MSKIRVLDCTLRDGGYVNDWKFGKDNINLIIEKLQEADIDVIECGYLSDKSDGSADSTMFAKVDSIADFISESSTNAEFVAMINYGDMKIENLPPKASSRLDGIRVAFHKRDLFNALEYCKSVKDLGYKLYIQPMISLGYEDKEFIDLINKANEIQPYAFYIVDSFGVMRQKDLMRLFYVVDRNLSKNICIGYHSHNNLQLAYSNAQSLVSLQTNRTLLIDSSVFGMGRGAGNLNTELFVEYLNESIGTEYKINPLLQIMDQVLNRIYLSNYWGYSLPHYLSAIHNCHPNYASYLDNKKTLTVEGIDAILDMLPTENRNSYNKTLIEDVYLRYMSGESPLNDGNKFNNLFFGKKVIVICPGKSSEDEKDTITKTAAYSDYITISVNFNYHYLDVDYIFLSNNRRLQKLDNSLKQKTIVTSNIKEDGFATKVDYTSLLNAQPNVKDNAGLMLIKYLITNGASEILLAGVDGYSGDATQNYAETDMTFITPNSVMKAMNNEMSLVLSDYSRQTNIKFLTKARFVDID